MNPSAPSFSAASAAPSDASACAVLVLDAMGTVVAANGTARALWDATEKGLISQSFTQLVAADAASAESNAISDWKSLKTATVDRSAPFSARRRDGSSFTVRVRLERSLGGAGTFIATIAPAM